ncbi:MAG: hypothetical protein HY319_09715 [Armatimonadetes bacterium]|nr:hypothetical protein [Armatimonadota bacterium]
MRAFLPLLMMLLLVGFRSPAIGAPAADLSKVGLRLAVYSPPEGPVRMVLRVENLGGTVAMIPQPSAQGYDFAVCRGTTEVWRWSADKFFIEQLQELSLQPGETRVFAEEWNRLDRAGRPVQPGHYTVNAWVPVLDRDSLKAEPRSMVLQAPPSPPAKESP